MNQNNTSGPLLVLVSLLISAPLLAHEGTTVRLDTTSRTVRIGSETHGWHQQLSAWGRPDAMRPITPGCYHQEGARRWWDHRELQEWYEPVGAGALEQGFTIYAPPAHGEGPLTLALDTQTGAMTAQASDTQLSWRTPQGKLRYGDLVAWDATGRLLPARMALVDGTTTLSVDDLGAVYPVVIDPTKLSQ